MRHMVTTRKVLLWSGLLVGALCAFTGLFIWFLGLDIHFHFWR
jgi:hypothetical protein